MAKGSPVSREQQQQSMMPTGKPTWVCKGLVTMWSPEASREAQQPGERGWVAPGAAAADTTGTSAGQRAHPGPGQAKGGTEGGFSPPTLSSSRLRGAGKAQLNHCSPGSAEHCIPQCSHTEDGATAPAVLWAGSWLLRALLGTGDSFGTQGWDSRVLPGAALPLVLALCGEGSVSVKRSGVWPSGYRSL